MIVFEFHESESTMPKEGQYENAWICRSWEDMENAINKVSEYIGPRMPEKFFVICSLQMSFLDDQRIRDWHYEGEVAVFVHDHTGLYEMKFGDMSPRTNREIRYEHSLFRMWTNGEFWP